MSASKAPQTRSLPTLIEDLEVVHGNLSDFEDHIPADSGTLAAIEGAVATLERIAEAAEDEHDAQVASDEGADDEEDDSDEG